MIDADLNEFFLTAKAVSKGVHMTKDEFKDLDEQILLALKGARDSLELMIGFRQAGKPDKADMFASQTVTFINEACMLLINKNIDIGREVTKIFTEL